MSSEPERRSESDADSEQHRSDRAFNLRETAALRLAHGRLPQPFGRYELQDRIGHGGMGIVFRAYDRVEACMVALKTIDEGFTREALERFRREAAIATKAHHAHIVPVYDVGEHEGQPYYTMLLVPGRRTLATASHKVIWKPRAAAELLVTIATAVHQLHIAGIVHRDLKPSNVLLDADGQPLIADFGLAKQVGAEALTETGQRLGTRAFMAPEQERGEHRKGGPASDIYSLGVILYVLITGRLPISGATRRQTAELLRSAQPTVPLVAGGAHVIAICLRCLEKEPRDRYASALELAQDLQRYLDGRRPLAARPLLRARRSLRLHGRRLLAAGLLALALLTALAWVWSEREARYRREILEGNVYSAQQVGQQFLDRMQQFGDRVLAVAQNGELRALLAAARTHGAKSPENIRALTEARALQVILERVPDVGEDAFVNWNVLDEHGRMLARTPAGDIIGESFADRDYFARAHNHLGKPGHGALHVSVVYQSRADEAYKFDLSAPVTDDAGRFLGVVAVSLTTSADMGLPYLQGRERSAVLLAPPEAAPDGPPYVAFIHPRYRPRSPAIEVGRGVVPGSFLRTCGDELSDDALGRAIPLELNYGDGRAFSGTWLAGIAPIGTTGFLVAVQSEAR